MTSFDFSDASLVFSGDFVDGTFSAQAGRKWSGRGCELAFVATGTDCSLPYFASASVPVSITVDGGTATTPALTTGSWQTGGSSLSLFSGLSEGAHTVVIKALTAGSANFYTLQTGMLTVTGAAPALSAATGYSNAQTRLTGTGVSSYILREGGGWTTSNQQNYPDLWLVSSWPDSALRFRATCTDIKLWAYGDGMRLRLYVDGVLSGSTVTVASDSTWNWRTVGSGLDDGAEHEYAIRFVKLGSGAQVFAYSIMTLGGSGVNTGTLAARDAWAFYGDSIVACSSAALTPPESWQGFPLKLSMLRGVQCANRGVGSTTVHQFSSGAATFTTEAGEATTRVSDVTGVSPAPSAVVILYGTNDLNQTGGTETTSDFETSYAQMLTRLIGGLPGATVFYCLGILDRADFASADIAPWDTAIQDAIASASGTAGSDAVGNMNLRFVSMDGVITPASDTGDGLHPTDGGYDKIVSAFQAAAGDAGGASWGRLALSSLRMGV